MSRPGFCRRGYRDSSVSVYLLSPPPRASHSSSASKFRLHSARVWIAMPIFFKSDNDPGSTMAAPNDTVDNSSLADVDGNAVHGIALTHGRFPAHTSPISSSPSPHHSSVPSHCCLPSRHRCAIAFVCSVVRVVVFVPQPVDTASGKRS